MGRWALAIGVASARCARNRTDLEFLELHRSRHACYSTGALSLDGHGSVDHLGCQSNPWQSQARMLLYLVGSQWPCLRVFLSEMDKETLPTGSIVISLGIALFPAGGILKSEMPSFPFSAFSCYDFATRSLYYSRPNTPYTAAMMLCSNLQCSLCLQLLDIRIVPRAIGRCAPGIEPGYQGCDERPASQVYRMLETLPNTPRSAYPRHGRCIALNIELEAACPAI
jgi:hypothetical protein